ncbi:MAG: hypothetical protein U9R26_06130 [Campylobacterota bacterium]|nr:hypothetical protein [Campylobacterota bacterium]
MELLNKSYIYALDPGGLILSLLYFVLLSGALAAVAGKMKVPFSAKAIIALYLYYYLFFLFASVVPIVPNFPDTGLFAGIITENYFPTHHGAGVKVFYYVTSPLRVLSLFKVELFILFQIFIFIITLMIIWKSWEIVMRKNSLDPDISATIFLILSALYPSFLLFVPVPLREFWVLFGFSVMVYGLVRHYYEDEALIDVGLGFTVIGSLILLTARPQLIVIVIIFLALFQKNRWLKYGLILASFFLVPYLYSTLNSFEFNPAFFRNVRNQAYEHFGASQMTYGFVVWNTYFDILKDLPKLFLQFTLSPFPILHSVNPLKLLAISVDMVFSAVIYFFALYAGLKLSKIYLFIFVVSAALFSIWEFHIGGAVRHRMPLLMILLPAASYGMVRFYHELRGE